MPVSKINLYISAAPELRAERAAIARMVPDIPTTLGWEIAQTPHSDQSFNADAVLQADVHLLVLGGDIKAPIGWELQLARRVGHRPFFFRQERLRTPAGDAFVRDLEPTVAWRTYRDPSDLIRQTAGLLVDHLISHAMQYALLQPEIERLRDWLKTAPVQANTATRPVTDSGAVIFTPERYMPSEGTIVE
jgi:hypothetical protein